MRQQAVHNEHCERHCHKHPAQHEQLGERRRCAWFNELRQEGQEKDGELRVQDVEQDCLDDNAVRFEGTSSTGNRMGVATWPLRRHRGTPDRFAPAAHGGRGEAGLCVLT